DEEGKVSMVWPMYLKNRSQDLPPRYHDAGMFYWLKPNKFMKTELIFSENSFGYEVSGLECHDIDSIIDWGIAELKFQRLQNKS
ncbi:MAG: pseudaminic acid cytidylyltransferase, partial [Bacteroidetes bacterium]|nr:pseudaminic acid cytidylyltransferase [Bacteroidota bacterium]